MAEITGEMKHAQRQKELIAKRMGKLLETSYKYYDKIYSGNISEADAERMGEELQEKAAQAEELEKTLRKIPFFGQLADIAMDLADLYKRAFALMLENMQYKKKKDAEKASENANVNANKVRLSDFEPARMIQPKKKDERTSQRNRTLKNIARTEIDYDQDPFSKKKDSNEKKWADEKNEINNRSNANKIKQERAAQARLDAYNKSVAERGRASESMSAQSQATGAVQQSAMGK